MGELVHDEGSVFIEIEASEGVYEPEISGSSALEVLSDGLSFAPTREILERNNRTSTVESIAGRSGIKSIAGTVPVEFRAGDTEGSLPEAHKLYKALLGGHSSYAASTTKVGNAVARLEIEDADIAKYEVGFPIMIKEAGAYHFSPISAKDSTPGSAYIDLLIPASLAFSDNVEIAAGVCYFHEAGAPTLSVTDYEGGKRRHKMTGMRPVTAELNNFSTGQLADIAFSLEGLSFDKEVATPLFSPVFSDQLPPVTLCAKVFRDDQEILVNELGLSLANTLGFVTATSSCNGKISSRITDFKVSGTFNPYASDVDVDNFDFFDQNTGFSLFAHTQNQADPAIDEFTGAGTIYVPNCRLPEYTLGDQDGLITEELGFTGHKTNGNDSIFLAFF